MLSHERTFTVSSPEPLPSVSIRRLVLGTSKVTVSEVPCVRIRMMPLSGTPSSSRKMVSSTSENTNVRAVIVWVSVTGSRPV